FQQISCRRLRQEDEYTGQQLTEAGGLFHTGGGSGDYQVLSFIAFILEETVDSCFTCSPLYFFEFVSCTAFLFTLLLLVLLSTKLHEKIHIGAWPTVDMIYTGVIAVLLFISSCIFAADRGSLVQATVAVVFGFLATVAFSIDFGLMVKSKGLPFLNKDKKQEHTNGIQTPAEEERLKANETV
uniref:MARVEL domain-containing protein n=1 Tax=Astatotilapia calliptera TaxID=8154 RepID=A0AAX7TVI8_ASTCA